MSEDDRSPTVSVALCTYNGARYLPQLLASLAQQTEQPDELVVQDDRSTDDTIAIVERFAAAAPFPVRLVVNDCTLRPANNFAACLARCVGAVAILTDQDDVWMPDRVARTRAAHRDPQVAFTFSDAPLIDADGQRLGRSILDTVPIRPGDRAQLLAGDDLFALTMRYGVLYGTTMSVSRETVTDALPIPAGWSHDEWLNLVGAVIGSSRRLDPVTCYRQHQAQVVGAGVAGVRAMMIGARDRTTAFYDREIARYQAAVQAMTDHPTLATALLPALQAKLAFLTARRTMRRQGWRGIGLLLAQIGQGSYGRFTGGSRSILKDLALIAGVAR